MRFTNFILSACAPSAISNYCSFLRYDTDRRLNIEIEDRCIGIRNKLSVHFGMFRLRELDFTDFTVSRNETVYNFRELRNRTRLTFEKPLVVLNWMSFSTLYDFNVELYIFFCGTYWDVWTIARLNVRFYVIDDILWSFVIFTDWRIVTIRRGIVNLKRHDSAIIKYQSIFSQFRNEVICTKLLSLVCAALYVMRCFQRSPRYDSLA